MKAILVNYNYTPEWLSEYPDLEPIIYDRSDDGVQRDLTKYGAVIKTPNMGNVDFDKLTWLVENYFKLPEVFLWGKTNIFKYVEPEQLRKALDAKEYKPLCKFHPTVTDQFGEIGYSTGGMYYERTDPRGWWTTVLNSNHTWGEWREKFSLPALSYTPFPPGGNFILTKERVHRHGVDLYDRMRKELPYCQLPAEAAHAERTYHLLWK